ncbi:unnamed protein product [Linum tenue]|uniref:UTP--glucose-1-phosphate uridylyltransferase n=1 Tax=Linum tenue TaxID=586396 RepID=A0AAV0GWR9_9ROSI|nr:unnamed protein product [Linum tenue]
MTIHSVVIQKLLSTNAHLGKRAVAQHFKIFTEGSRAGVSIIDSDKTLICLRNATNFIAQLAREKKARFLFVNTNPLFDEIVEQMTKKIGLYSPRDKVIWKMGGFLTNSFSPKKFRSRNKKVCFAPVQPPDCVVVLDTDRKSSVILEAARLQVPIVALVDSSLPRDYYEKIAYPVPANDSMEFVYLFCNIITKTFLLERKKMGEAKGDTIEDEPATSTEELGEEVHRCDSMNRISSVADKILVVPYESLAPVVEGSMETKRILDKLVVVKFNGTLGTAVGFDGPKSLVEVCDSLTSLDLVVNQIQNLNQKHGSDIPLVLINSSVTHDDTSKVLEKISRSNIDILPVQQGHQSGESPGLQETENEPYDFWPPVSSFCAPLLFLSHHHCLSFSSLAFLALHPSDQAAAFRSLINSGALDILLAKGKEYVLVVSSDNSAAVVDAKILNHLISNNIEYCMEVTPTPSSYSMNPMANESEGKFQAKIAEDTSTHPMENFKLIDTKTLWVSLKAIKRLVDTNSLTMENLSTSKEVEDNQLPQQDNIADLPIRLFNQAIGVNVPQSRSLQLNATSDLLLMKSDLYSAVDGSLVRNPARISPMDPSIELGPEFEKIDDFQSRFQSIPSIVELDSLKVTGDVWFGTGVTLKGRVSIHAEPGTTLKIPDDTVIENKELNDPANI